MLPNFSLNVPEKKDVIQLAIFSVMEARHNKIYLQKVMTNKKKILIETRYAVVLRSSMNVIHDRSG